MAGKKKKHDDDSASGERSGEVRVDVASASAAGGAVATKRSVSAIPKPMVESAAAPSVASQSERSAKRTADDNVESDESDDDNDDDDDDDDNDNHNKAHKRAQRKYRRNHNAKLAQAAPSPNSTVQVTARRKRRTRAEPVPNKSSTFHSSDEKQRADANRVEISGEDMSWE